MSWISIEGEKGAEFGDMFRRKDWVFGGDVLGEDGFEFFLSLGFIFLK